jgi:hypothetical protein
VEEEEEEEEAQVVLGASKRNLAAMPTVEEDREVEVRYKCGMDSKTEQAMSEAPNDLGERM